MKRSGLFIANSEPAKRAVEDSWRFRSSRFDEGALAEDDRIWDAYMRQIMPTIDELDERLRSLPAYDPARRLTPAQLESLSHIPHNPSVLSLQFLRRAMEPVKDNRWIAMKSTRCLYEVMVATYLPLVARADLVDFKVAIDDGIHRSESLRPGSDGQCPASLDGYVGNWVNHLARDDDVFCDVAGTPAPIVRRAWIIAFNAEFRRGGATVDSGHQILVVAEKLREQPANVVIHIVDNIPSENYREFVDFWFEESLRAHFTRALPGLSVVKVQTLLNGMPTCGTLGTCMSASFRAVMLFSFLHDPVSRIRLSGEEGPRFLKLMYLQLLRMRHCLLGMRREENAKDILLSFVPPHHPVLHSLHNIEGVSLWLVSRALTQEGDVKQKGADGNEEVIPLREYIRRLGDMVEMGGHLTRLHFNRDLTAPISAVFQRHKNSTPCVVSARFGARVNEMYKRSL